MMTIICAYCRKTLGTKEGGNGTTHTICTECLKEQNRLLEEMIKESKSGPKN